MDFFFWSSVAQNLPTNLIVLYDIGCQWSRDLQKHCGIYGSQFGLLNPFTDHQLR